MGAYDFNFDLPDGETFCPSPARVRALAKLLPADNFSTAPRVTDRAAWDPWREDPFGQRMRREARAMVQKPSPTITDQVFLHCLKNEDVTEFNAMNLATRTQFNVLILAEAIFDEGEFLPLIEADVRSLAQLSTWVHPNNDLEKKNFSSQSQDNDLHSVHHGISFVLIHHVLGPRISDDLGSLVFDQVTQRMLSPMRQKIEAGRDLDWWLIVKHNWNSVCLSCYAHAAVALLPDVEDRAWWLAFTESLAHNFTDGFADDGLCTEGVSYWNYGFTHYILLAELLRRATGNTLDLLDTPKVRRIARFADRAEIQPGKFPAFSDCSLVAQPGQWIRSWLDNRRDSQPDSLAQPAPAHFDPLADIQSRSIDPILLWMFGTRDPRQPLARLAAVALRDFFAPSHFLISRSAPTTRRQFAATFLGGNNGVNHNHNDLGTFTVLLNGQALIYDPGPEVYSMRTFSTRRYESQLLNSYGHPVPRIGGRLQEPGFPHQAPTLLTEFTDDVDRMVLDLRGGYDCPSLRKLEREFIFDRRGDGKLTLTDTVEFSEPTAFESALITAAQITESIGTIRLGDAETAITVDYSAAGQGLTLSRDTLNQPPHPTRLAFALSSAVTSASVRFVIRPEPTRAPLL